MVTRNSFQSILLASFGFFYGSLCFAQEEVEDASPEPSPAVTADGMTEAERVMVTGSNIPTAAEVGPNPVQTIDRQTIEKSGERNTEELLRNLPVANANGVPASGNAVAVFGEGAASIALRGLDTGATLILIDGHRIAPHPSGTTGGIQAFVDLNTIPRAAIESVEILKDGASTTYGADAIAGVVNIKLRRDYRGAEINSEYGNTTDRDSGELAASLVFGIGNDRTNLTGVVNYYSRNSIFSHDRNYDVNTPLARTSTNASPFNLEVSRAAAEAAAGRPITEVDPTLDTFFAHAPFLSNGSAPAADYAYTDSRSSTFPYFRYQAELPDTERYGTFLNVDHKVFGDQLVAYADLLFQRADVDYEAAPSPTFAFQSPGALTLAIPPHIPGATLGGPTYQETGVPLGAYNPFNPFQQIISGESRGRLFDFGPREFNTRTDSFFVSAGLRGEKLFNGAWGYDAAFRYSRVESDIDIRLASASRFNRVLNAADSIFDPTSPQFIGTTVPYNPFGDYHRPIGNNFRFTNFVTIHAMEKDVSSLTSFDLNIYSTELFRLPAGPAGLALGAQFLHETEEQNPDKALLTGDLVSFGGAFFAVSGSRDSYAGFAETSVPVFGADFSASGFHALDFTAAVRFEAFSNDTNVMVPKFGMRWQPFDESLTVRATWGEGFRQPTLVELFAPPIFAGQDIFDPIRKEFVTDVPTTFLANPNLQPEDSREFSGGVVYTPKFASGLTLSIDIFNIETTGWVNPFPDPTRVIQRIENGNSFPGESVTRDADGHLIALTQVTYENSGTQKVRGTDFTIAYELTTSFGAFHANIQATYLDSYQFSPFPGQKELELRSSPVDFFADDAYLKWKGLSRLDWSWHGFSTAVTAHYLDGFHEILALGPTFPDNKKEHWVKQTWFFDLQASYEIQTNSAGQENRSRTCLFRGWPSWRCLLDHTRVTIGCNNIFDHDPPESTDNFPRFIYDTTGRFVYLSVTKKFW